MSTCSISRLSVLAFGLAFIAGPCFAAEQKNLKVDQVFASWDRPDSPGAAVVVVKDGAVVYQHGYGSANLEARTPITPQTVFDVASVAKQFTGLALAMLVEEGKISLDDDIHKYLPEVPDFGRPITIDQLVHHTSGLRDWPETLALAGFDLGGAITLDTILEMVHRQRELDFTPGSEHLYSNTGYNLLAAAIAKVTGQSFRAWSDAQLFQPLGMKHTVVCEDPAKLVPNRAESYTPAGETFHHAVSQLAAQGSSSLFISAEDMGKWLMNFETGRAGGKRALERMQQPGKLTGGGEVHYGFGLGLGDFRGCKFLSHTGAWAGYRSVVLVVPEKRLALAILSNAGNMDTYGLGIKVAQIYLGELPAAKPTASSAKPSGGPKNDLSNPDAFLGTYRLGPGWLLDITREGSQLMVQATHEDKFKMTAVSNATYFVAAYGANIEFLPEKSGDVTHLLYRGIKAPRLTVPQCTPDMLAAYTGDYWSEELRVAYHLELTNGQLALRHRSGSWIRFLPTGLDHFDTDVGSLGVEFTRNSGSQIAEMKVSGGRVRNVRFVRGLLPKPSFTGASKK
jgi:CubicO group peptidase (beta-lactamase class C family)